MPFRTKDERQQLFDAGPQVTTMVGADGGRKSEAMSKKAVATGGAGDGVRQRGRSTTHFQQPTGGTSRTLKKFRESAKTMPADDPTLSNIQALARSQKLRPEGVKGKVQALGPVTTGGTDRPTGKIKAEPRVSYTDTGSFRKTKGGKTLREGAGGKELGLFGSASRLAKLFMSPEYQKQQAKNIQAGVSAKGKRADAKAKNEKIKALSGVFKNLSETPGENEGLMAKVSEQIQALISGDEGAGVSGEVLGKFAEAGYDAEQVTAIMQIMGKI